MTDTEFDLLALVADAIYLKMPTSMIGNDIRVMLRKARAERKDRKLANDVWASVFDEVMTRADSEIQTLPRGDDSQTS